MSSDEQQRHKTMEMNLSAMRRHDSDAVAIVDTCPHVAMYTFKEKWIKSGIEGSLIIYKRSSAPFYVLCILNRTSPTNLHQQITEDLEIQHDKTYLFYRSMSQPDAVIQGLWFYKEEDLLRTTKLLAELKADTAGVANLDVLVPRRENGETHRPNKSAETPKPLMSGNQFINLLDGGANSSQQMPSPAKSTTSTRATGKPGIKGVINVADLERAMCGDDRPSSNQQATPAQSTNHGAHVEAESPALAQLQEQREAAMRDMQKQFEIQKKQIVEVERQKKQQQLQQQQQLQLQQKQQQQVSQAPAAVSPPQIVTNEQMAQQQNVNIVRPHPTFALGPDETLTYSTPVPSSLLTTVDYNQPQQQYLVQPQQQTSVVYMTQAPQQHQQGHQPVYMVAPMTQQQMQRNYSMIPNVGSPTHSMQGADTMSVNSGFCPPSSRQQSTNLAALTKDQFRESLCYILNNDDTFVTQIHEAYMKSVKEKMARLHQLQQQLNNVSIAGSVNGNAQPQ